MDKSQTIKWIVAALVRGAAFVVAAKLGQDAVSEQSWTALAEGLTAAAIAGLSIYTSVRGRKQLQGS